ncbi:MAG: DUF3987 domain-containing protein [Thiolinea sp.]
MNTIESSNTYDAIVSDSRKIIDEKFELTIQITNGKYKGQRLQDLLDVCNDDAKLEAICSSANIVKTKDISNLHNKPIQVEIGEHDVIKGYCKNGKKIEKPKYWQEPPKPWKNTVEPKLLSPSNLTLANLQPTLNTPLSFPPGFVGALAEAIYHMAERPVLEVAIAGALGLMAGVCGKAWATLDNPTGLNLYLVLLARSAIGKEAMHTGIKYIMDNTDDPYTPLNDFVTYNSPASAQGLQKMLEDKHSVLNGFSEFGHLLDSMVSNNANSHMKAIVGLMLRLYAQSGPNDKTGGLMYSDAEKNTKGGNYAYSLLGETTPHKFNNCVTPEVMAEGLMSRFTVIEYIGERPKRNKNRTTPSKELLDHFFKLKNIAYQQQLNSPHKQVNYDLDGKSLLDDFSDECDDFINKAGHDESLRQTWNRAHLTALKIACLLAIGDNPENPVLTTVHAEWAINLVKRNVQIFVNKLSNGDIGEPDDEVREKKIREVCQKYFINRTINDKEYPDLVNKGVIRRRVLTSNTSRIKAFKSHKLGAAKALDLHIGYLIKEGQLTRISDADRIDKYGVAGGELYMLTSEWIDQ